MKKTVIGIFLVLIFVGQSLAADFGNALSIATFNIPAGADIASMGNADAAAPDFSSNNPAIIGYSTAGCKGGVSGGYGLIDFSHGPSLSLYSVYSQINANRFGNFQIGYATFNSGASGMLMDVDAKFNPSNSFSLQWGKAIVPKLCVGLGGSYSKSEMTFSLEGYDLLKSKSESFSFSGGVLYSPIEKIFVGGYYAHSFDRSEDTDLIFEESESSNSGSDQIKVGANYQILPMTMAAVNYQFLNIDGYGKNQFFAGIEQGIIKDLLYVYGGWADSGPTAGLGLYLENGGVNISYMRHPFSDLRPYLGQAEMYSIQVYLNF